MYCPKCSQEQVLDEARFCSRCGFQLGVVAELMATDGVLINVPPPPTAEKLSKYRQVISSIGAKIIFFGILSIPFTVLLGMPFDSPVFLLISFLVIFIGLMQIFYVQIFGKKNSLPEAQSHKLKNLHSTDSPSKLSAPAEMPVPIFEIRERETSEFVSPPSVTETTTKLLKPDGVSSEN